MKWTPEQQLAISDRGHTLLVAAAAGSGKTAVLIERIASLILGGADVERMLIVTFTSAAAAEMRQRLINRLESESKALIGTNPTLAARIEEQAQKCPRAQVKTLHSFCQWILQRAFETVDVDPGFRVCDAQESGVLMSRALEDTLSAAYDELETSADVFTSNLRKLNELRGPDSVGQLVLALYRFLESRPDPEEWLSAQETGATWDAQLKEIRSYVALTVRRSHNVILSALDIANGADTSIGDAPQYADTLTIDADTWPVPGDSNALATYEPVKLRASGSRSKETHTPAAELVKQLRTKAKKLLLDARALDAANLPPGLDVQEQRQRDNLPAITALCELVRRFTSAYAARKRERTVLDFSDLEHLALKALTLGAADGLRSSFDHVFVDEYQDISLVQESILSLLSHDDNRFMVGDVKQSIYRFRQAEPGLFIRKYASFASPEHQSAQALRIDLNRNFRSRANLINFVNAVMGANMHSDEYELDYDDAASLKHGRDASQSPDPPVELHLFAHPDDADDASLPELDMEFDVDSPPPRASDSAVAAMSRVEQEADLAAGRIRELLGSLVFDAASGSERPLEPRDIAVLSRKVSGIAQVVLEVFTRNGVPVYADAAGGYFSAYEVRQSLALLRLIENRRRDYDLLAVMRSPMYGFTSVELAELRADYSESVGRTGARASFYDAILAAAPLDTPLGRRVATFLDDISRWQRSALELPLAELFWHIMDETGFYAYVGVLPGGAQRQSNLNLLAERASGYEQTQFGGLHGFLQYISQLQRSQQDMGAASALSEADNVVRVMSVHKSKGLEFPVVIALNLGAKPGITAKSELACHGELGLAIPLMDESHSAKYTTLGQRAIDLRLRRDQLAEELRVMYVLLTRARERLILIGSVRGDAKSALASWRAGCVGEARNMLDWLMPVAVRYADIQPSGEQPNVRLHLHALGAEASEPSHTSLDLPLARLNSQPPDPQFVRRLSWQYPHSDAVYAPLKLTVSQLHREYEGPIHFPERRERPAFMETQGLTAREAGIATHSFMQWMELAPLRECGPSRYALRMELNRQLDAMRLRGTLSQARAESVRIDDVCAFLLSDIGQALLHSDTVHREWPFNLRLYSDDVLPGDDQPVANANAHERLLVQGVIDCCFIAPGDIPGHEPSRPAWYLLDYKTGHISLGSPDDIRAAYESQLRLYALALERITGIPVAGKFVYMLRSHSSLPI